MNKAIESEDVTLADSSNRSLHGNYVCNSSSRHKLRLESIADERETDIFSAKTPSEISRIYNKLLVSLGKWNAETYLTVLKSLGENENVDVQKLCPEAQEIVARKQCIYHEDDKPLDFYKSTVFKQMEKECETELEKPVDYPVVEEDHVIEPSYKKIFANAKLSRKSQRDDEGWWGYSLSAPVKEPSSEDSKVQTSAKLAMGRTCKLMPDGENNYLLQIRSRRQSLKKTPSLGSFAVTKDVDNATALFNQVPVKVFMEDHLADQVDLNQMTIGERIIKFDPDDETRGLNHLKHEMLGNDQAIASFQDKLNDVRWRKKFDLDKIELSDEFDTTDGSEIYLSDSSSLCSGDSFDTSINGKTPPPKTSRIPFIDEVKRTRDALFKKISLKWEKVLTKNHIDSNLRTRPIFREIYSKIRLRSRHPFYHKILESLNSKYEGVYSKTFVPYKYVLRSKIQKDIELQKAVERKDAKSRQFQLICTDKAPDDESKSISYTPTKHLTNNQRVRLKRIMRDVQHKQEEGLTDWSRKAFVEDYVNLRPIISTKGAKKLEMVQRSSSRHFSATPILSKVRPQIQDFRHPSMEYSSTFFQPNRVEETPVKKGLVYVRFDVGH